MPARRVLARRAQGELAGNDSCPITTFGVTTVRHTTLAGPRQGQMDEYTLSHELKGTASIVMT